MAVNDDMPDGADTEREALEGLVVAGRYRIEHVVASGASTVITEATDTRDDIPVTLKVVRPELALHSSFRDDFRRHVDAAMALAHPNIARVLGWGRTQLDGEPTVFWVVEYLGGGSLRDLFDRGRLLQPSQALVVGLEACRALDAGHGAGLVHTELTPSKLVFGADSRLRVVDFSMAELFGADAWKEPATVATHVARYASPEQALSLEVDQKTDVYALSLCLIEAITGNVPFAGDSTVSTLAARIGKLMPVTADMGSLAAVLERAGRPEPEDRWTAAEFGAALVQAAETLPRPDPIPILASSLFATSLLQRQANLDAAAAAPVAESPADEELPAGEEAPVDEELPVDEEPPVDEELPADEEPPVDDAASAAAVTAAMAAAASTTSTGGLPAPGADDPHVDEPVVVLTDVADPPTGAVEVADGADDADGADATGADDAGDDAGSESATTEVMAATAPMAATTQLDTVDPTSTGGIYDDERDSRPWGRYIAIAMLVVAGLVALGVAAFLLLRTESFEVPDLVGVDEAVALNEVAGNGWVIETNRERSDEVPEIDHVVRTIPPAGEMLAEGETFVIYVSDGPELRTIPELTGVPVSEARAELDELSLSLVEAGSEFSEDVPAGSIVSWQVEGNASLVAGAQVLPGTVIEAVVSQGPEPRPAPDLANLTLDEATAALEDLQLEIARGEDQFSSTIEVGRVVSQGPSPTTPVDRGGTVTVRISKGPDLVAFPDLTGQTYPQALETLEAAGFTENSLLGTTEGTFVSASIDGSEVGPGDRFLRGTAVDLIFL
jgi:eukaryotic-like serine/threonine-protein kinase